MKKKTLVSLFGIISLLVVVFVACQKSGELNDESNTSKPDKATLNNLKVDASTVKGWLSDSKNTEITFTFFSKSLSDANSKMTLMAFPFDKNNPTILEIASKSNIEIKENIGFSNNYISVSSIKKLITKQSGEIADFDYILLEPKYFEDQSGSYVHYKFTPYKNGSPLNNIQLLRTVDDCLGSSKPSPPAPPCDQE